VVHTIHGLAFDRYQPAVLNALYIGLERLCARHADVLVSVCDTMTEQARAAGVGTAAQFRTIYSGFDLAAFTRARQDRAAARTRLGIPADTCVLLHVGRLFPLKGAEDFIEAVACARHLGRSVLGVLVGDGPLRPLLERRVAEQGLEKAVRCAGLVPPADIPCWAAAADVLVHASVREGLARAVVQALAAGVPVVTYDIGGAKEVVRDGVNGIVCTAGDTAGLCAAAAELAHNDHLRARLAAGAAATDLHRFAAGFMVEEIAQLYGTLRGI
jgi:glycosyltransferase involved in cell wall biosynthesis